jgi:hypothetical protein
MQMPDMPAPIIATFSARFATATTSILAGPHATPIDSR